MNHFYLTLPSDSSSKFYPENTTACYRTKLCERVDLDGEYEVGLAQLIYPHSWLNFINADESVSTYIVDYNGVRVDYIFSSGQFVNEQSLVDSLNNHMGEAGVRFSWRRELRKLHLSISALQGGLYMSEGFVSLFGFRDIGPYAVGEHTASNAFDLNNSIHFLYVYCDIASYTLVGDTKVPLLRVCDTQGEYGEMARTIFTHPHYVPLARGEFEAIEININNELGKPVPFEFGKAVVTLHFRRKNKLLLSRRLIAARQVVICSISITHSNRREGEIFQFM